jgi:DNA-binding CsgD family transcriptional regulator
MRRFSQRERDVIDEILRGHTTYEDLAKSLGVSEKAIQNHLLKIYKLTGVPNMAGLIIWLMKQGYDVEEE